MLITKEQKDFYFKQAFDKFLEHHKDCYHFSDHILARELFDICVEELEKQYEEIIDSIKGENK